MKFKSPRIRRPLILSSLIAAVILLSILTQVSEVSAADGSDTIVLRVGNWEEYIDKGGWDEDETIKLGDTEITSKNGLVSDFQDWYYKTYGKQVKVKYSTYGTNEDLYSQLILGDSFDLICPSDYMIMKMMKENMLQPLSKDFFDKSNEYNYYTRGVSPYISNIFNHNKIDGKTWGSYAAGYMWGVVGIVYNPEKVREEDADSWSILTDPQYAKRITVKDSVKETYFPVLAILNKDLLLSKDFISAPDYPEKQAKVMNDTSPRTIAKTEPIFRKIRQNVYSFETESGKADMVTGKVVANLQWSGDGSYTLDQAEEDGLTLNFSVPKEGTNLWFDGFVMLKSGINGDPEKQKAAEAFINFVSRPDNVVRNMYYVGYTSPISGGDNDLIYQYVKLKYGAEEDEKDTVNYPLGNFFSGNNKDAKYILKTSADQAKRQLFAQYPPEDVLRRSAVMGYFTDDVNAELNQMWIDVRCFNFDQIPMSVWLKALAVICLIAVLVILSVFRGKIFRKPVKSGFYRVD